MRRGGKRGRGLGGQRYTLLEHPHGEETEEAFENPTLQPETQVGTQEQPVVYDPENFEIRFISNKSQLEFECTLASIKSSAGLEQESILTCFERVYLFDARMLLALDPRPQFMPSTILVKGLYYLVSSECDHFTALNIDSDSYNMFTIDEFNV
jgi:hypothetical protein